MRRENSVVAQLLDLPGVWVVGVSFGQRDVTVDVRLRRRRLACPYCGYLSWFRHETRPVDSTWVHLDLGRWGCVVRARLRRLACPRHGVVVEAVPFARPRARFTRDFEDLVAWLVTKMDKTAVCRLARIDWKTVGRIGARVVADGLDPARLDGLVRIGVDEVAWRRGHSYLTLVADHARGKIVWGTEGREAAALDGLFAELGEQRSGGIEAVSMDLAPAYAKSVAEHAPQARICADPFHVVKLATDALNTLRRQVWQDMRKTDPVKAKTFKGARWALLKNPTDLTDQQAATLRRLRRRGGELWRGYRLKESLRAIFAGDLGIEEVGQLLDRWISQAQRSGLAPFVKTAKTVRKHRDRILAAIRLGINNGRSEGLNNVVRRVFNRAYGLHSAEAALALILLCCGPIELILPHERSP
jgi:transposase